MPFTPAPSVDAAITLALAALEHMARSDAVSSRFLADSGMSPGAVGASAAEPEFLAAVLDFYLSDDALVVDLATGLGVAPEDVAIARQRLPGGELPHWT